MSLLWGGNSAYVAQAVARARADGARCERKRSQNVLAGAMTVAAVEAIIIFILAVWR